MVTLPSVKDLSVLLDSIPVWKRLKELPDRVAALEARLNALETRPKLPLCPACGVGHLRLIRQEGLGGKFEVLSTGTEISVFKCDNDACGFEKRDHIKN